MPSEEKPGRQPLPPAVRARLQKFFQYGTEKSATGNFDYAAEMYQNAVVGDPSNPIYVKALLNNLSKKYANNKTGAKMANLKLATTKLSIKNSTRQKKWDDVLKTGLEALLVNPWDNTILFELANACEAQDFDEAQVEYLRQAIDANPDDAEANRQLGRAYDNIAQYTEAIDCFRRVLKELPKDEEAMRAMSNLAVKRTMVKGGYEGAESTRDVRKAKFGAAASDDEEADLTPVEKLLRAIKKEPSEKSNYIELNDLYMKDELFDKSTAIMKQALEAVGTGDPMLTERYEDAELRLARQHMQISEQKAKAEKTPESIDMYNRMRVELNNKEMEIYGKRCDRYPTNLGFKYELAMRLQRAGKFQEAIKLFQEAKSDSKRKGTVFLALGDCFYNLKQYRLAMQHYELAVGEISERDPDAYKGAIYKAGRIAEHLKEWESAQKHYNLLASSDFGYKDVAERLDKINTIRENGGDPDSA
jgi:tetratricopeptide (TPR) repeat protein